MGLAEANSRIAELEAGYYNQDTILKWQLDDIDTIRAERDKSLADLERVVDAGWNLVHRIERRLDLGSDDYERIVLWRDATGQREHGDI